MKRFNKFIRSISENGIVVLILLLKDFYEIAIPFFTNVNTMPFDYFDFALKAIISVSLWLILREYYRIKDILSDQLLINRFLSLKIDTDSLFTPENKPYINTVLHNYFSTEEINRLVHLKYLKTNIQAD